MKHSTLKNNIIASLISILFIIGLLSIVSHIKQDNQIFPSLSEIGNCLYANIVSKEVVLSFTLSIMRTFLVLFISLVFSLITSLLYYYKKITMSFLRPFITIMKTAPLAAISIYIFIIVDGQNANNLRPLLIGLLVTFPIILEGTISAVDHIDPSIISELALTSGPKWFKFIKIYLPLMIPNIATTLLQTIGLGFKVIVMAEYLCYTKQSIGLLIYNSFMQLNMANLLAIIILVVIIVVIGEFIVKKIEKNILKAN